MYIILSFLIALLAVIITTNSFRISNNAVSRKTSSSLVMQEVKKSGAGFNYDPSNYKDSNSGNYRRLSDQLAAKQAEDDKLQKERDELMRKEQMAAMFLRQENSTFWNTPGDKIVADSENFFVDADVLQVITDLDNQLVGLKPVKEKMRRYAAQMLIHKIRK